MTTRHLVEGPAQGAQMGGIGGLGGSGQSLGQQPTHGQGAVGGAADRAPEENLALFEYIDGFYHSRRIQKRLGHLSPTEFEDRYYAEQRAADILA
ncbi:hypothetical protein OTB20_39460 [Streptomyces sp. H27-H1]|uniref:IS3 family transposase n=1 Tax=Streptomyces sp. H27-H1 TaxID=2996461 RepID=UPI002270C4AA|nr:IS3 family transposase [Streptomyces sp. H27-H1]MCY0932142.1 hypothetical protein [Streptomyces sp. H27-H1]